MTKIVTAIICGTLILAGLACGKKSDTGTGKPADIKTSQDGTSYRLDGKSASSGEFQETLSRLKQVSGTWFCAETKNGGITGYDMKDRDGRLYEFRSVSENGSNWSEIRRKNVLK